MPRAEVAMDSSGRVSFVGHGTQRERIQKYRDFRVEFPSFQNYSNTA